MNLSRREALAFAATAAGLAGVGRARAASQALPSITSGAAALALARTAIDLSTTYEVGGALPPPGGWRKGKERTDCSGLVLWSFGLGRRDQRLTPNLVSTDDIYADALGPQRLFRRIARPKAGGIVVYPRYNLGNGIADYGHIGIISKVIAIDPEEKGFAGSLREVERFAVIDCSGSAYRIFGDAVRENDYLKFLLHDELVSQARRFQPCIDPSNAMPPIFAASVADADPAVEHAQQRVSSACKSDPTAATL